MSPKFLFFPADDLRDPADDFMQIVTLTPTPISEGQFWQHFGPTPQGGVNVISAGTAVFDQSDKTLTFSGAAFSSGVDFQFYITYAISGRSPPPNTKNFAHPVQNVANAIISIPEWVSGNSVTFNIHVVDADSDWIQYSLIVSQVP